MEKIVYALWSGHKDDRSAFNERLLTEVARELEEQPIVRGIQLNLCDAAVAAAEGLRQTNTRPQMDAVVQLWVDSAIDMFRRPLDMILEQAAERIAGYLVTESQPIRNTLHPPKPGERTEGWSQVVFLTRPPRLQHAAWLDNWHRLHTPVAIETQSNFEYTQNVVARPLTYAAPPYDAIVEECFPAAAMTDPHVFFDAVDDEGRYRKNLGLMMESCARFIDFERIDVIPTSQFIVKSAR